jgi:hypothetical protein
MAEAFKPGDAVVIPWGVDEVKGTVAEIYGAGAMLRVVVALRPEESGFVVDEPTTATLPADAIRYAGVAA